MRQKLAERIRGQLEPQVRPGEELKAAVYAFSLGFAWWRGLL